MSIEKIDQSIYFHPEINSTHRGVLNTLSGLLNQDECVIFYRPRGATLTNPEEKSSAESSTKNERECSEGGMESAISQVIVFQDKVEKNLVPFYCSKDKTCFALFYGKEVFKNIRELSEWTANELLRKAKSKKKYDLISLMEKKPTESTKHLSPEILQEMARTINQCGILNNFEFCKHIFPKKYTKKDKEPIVFGDILTITAVSGLNLYLIKTKELFALIAEEELLTLNYYLLQKKNVIKDDESVVLNSCTSSSTTHKTSVTTAITSAPFFSSESKSESKTEKTLKRKYPEIATDSTKTEQAVETGEATKEENPAKCLKKDPSMG